MANRYHVQDDGELQAAVAAYFEAHPEINPDRVSVELAVDHDWVPGETPKYRAVGHLVVVPLPGIAVGSADVPLEELAGQAFAAYSARLGHANHTMDVAEGWTNQGHQIREGFFEAARAVRDRVLNKTPEAGPGLADGEPGK